MHTSDISPRIVIRQLALDARIGVHDWEKVRPQPIVLDLEFDVADRGACLSDRLEDTVDYSEVVERLRGVALRPHELVESMAGSMCASVLQVPDVQRVRLTLTKLAPYPGAQVGVVLQRERSRAAVATRELRRDHEHQHV